MFLFERSFVEIFSFDYLPVDLCDYGGSIVPEILNEFSDCTWHSFGKMFFHAVNSKFFHIFGFDINTGACVMIPREIAVLDLDLNALNIPSDISGFVHIVDFDVDHLIIMNSVSSEEERSLGIG